jgi:anti-sigma factor (TIGR02949 family)
MNCAQARFLLYAYLDRGVSESEAETLSRHLAECPSCDARGRSARSLARVLRSGAGRAAAPVRLRERLHHGEVYPARFRYPLFATAAVVLFLLIPLVADVSGHKNGNGIGIANGPNGEAPETVAAATGLASMAGVVPISVSAPPSSPRHAPGASPALVSRRMTGTLVCLDCEARLEAGLCPLPQARHETAFCADNGEVWRLMPRDPMAARNSAGQTLTVEGVGFLQSGFLRANRVGY